MKRLAILLLAAGILSAAHCRKEGMLPARTDTGDTPDSLLHWLTLDEPITAHKIIRNDIPPPPETEWRNIDTMTLNKCERRLWRVLQTIYPIPDPNYFNYHLYAIHEPDTSSTTVRSQSYQPYHEFFREVDCWVNCPNGAECAGQLDTTFFLKAIGPYTARTFYKPYGAVAVKEISYVYFFKPGARRGPCPYIWEITDEYPEWHYDHFMYCDHLLRLEFKPETGHLIRAAFF